MASWKYYSLTMFLFTTCTVGAAFIDDIGIIFEFVGAFGLTITSFTLPAVMYLIMIKNPKAFLEVESDRQRFWNKIGSICLITFSILNGLSVIVKQIYPGDED